MSIRAAFLFAGTALAIAGIILWRKRGITRSRRKRNNENINLGGVFGMDIGGTLTKIVYFEADLNDSAAVAPENSTNPPTSVSVESPTPPAENSSPPLKRISSLSLLSSHKAALSQLYSDMTVISTNASSTATSSTNDSSHSDSEENSSPPLLERDTSLSFHSAALGGRLHFLHFETRRLASAVDDLSHSGLLEGVRSLACTGGGSLKYAEVIQSALGIRLEPLDEMGCLVAGMHFALTAMPGECYTFRDRESSKEKTAKDSNNRDVRVEVDFLSSISSNNSSNSNQKQSNSGKSSKSSSTNPSTSPYLLVNVGSGVSILKVSSPTQFERVSGTSVGGGSFFGLSKLLTGRAKYSEVLRLAAEGRSDQVDMLVRDIYGGDYSSIGLSGDTVASSFGKLVMRENAKDGIREEDLVAALLQMITVNIAQIAYLNAKLHGCSKIFFVGSFLRLNTISCKKLAFAIDFWSKGEMEALFLKHEGYFGAVGSFLKSAFGSELDNVLKKGIHNYVSHSKVEEDEEKKKRESQKAISIKSNLYGLDNEFMNRLKNWRPLSFDAFREIKSKGSKINMKSESKDFHDDDSKNNINFSNGNSVNSNNLTRIEKSDSIDHIFDPLKSNTSTPPLPSPSNNSFLRSNSHSKDKLFFSQDSQDSQDFQDNVARNAESTERVKDDELEIGYELDLVNGENYLSNSAFESVASDCGSPRTMSSDGSNSLTFADARKRKKTM